MMNRLKGLFCESIHRPATTAAARVGGLSSRGGGVVTATDISVTIDDIDRLFSLESVSNNDV